MIKLLIIGAGGFVGAVLRYGISVWAIKYAGIEFPYGTLIVNLLGSFLLGFLLGYGEAHILNPQLRLFAAVGLLGAFTTFSTFSVENIMLLEMGQWTKLMINAAGSVVLGLALAWIGLKLGRGL